MKSNWIKYVFIVFVVGVTIFAIYKMKQDESTNEQSQTQSNTKQEEKITEIKLGVAEMDTINPILSNNKNVQTVTKLIYEPLVNLSADYKAEPCLATEWAKQSDNSYLVKLRENVRWSDGQIFTAEDVRYTMDKLKEVSSIYSYNVEHVIGIDVVDDFTVRINLDQEIPFFEYNLTFPIMSKEYYNTYDFSDTERNKASVGTGMYKISESEPSYITLVKNNNWWNKEEKLTLEKININLYSSIGELYNSFKMGSLDMLGTANDNIQEYVGSIGYSTKEITGREHVFLAFNTQNVFLSQLEVRKAMAYSIDKENINSSVLNNKYNLVSFPLDYGNWLYQNQDSSSGYNVEQAKQVLVDAGWSYKNQYWQKTVNYKTQKISLNILVKSSDTKNIEIATNIKNQLDNQGIRVEIVQASDQQYQNSIESKNYDIALCSIYVSASPNMNTFFGDNNLANYSNEEVKEILNVVKNTTDDNILKEKYKRLSEIYKTDIPYLSLCSSKYTVAYNSSLAGDVTPNWYNLFYGISGWYK